MARSRHPCVAIAPMPRSAPSRRDGSITHANVGVVWFSVRVTGRPAHAREMQAGINAIDAAYQVVGALRVLEEQLNVEAAQHPLFQDLTHPINLNIGQIEGGDWNSTVPAVMHRPLPPVDVAGHAGVRAQAPHRADDQRLLSQRRRAAATRRRDQVDRLFLRGLRARTWQRRGKDAGRPRTRRFSARRCRSQSCRPISMRA